MSIVVVDKNNRYTVESLYQWDLNQVLEIRGLSLPRIPEIHFTNGSMDRAIVKQATMDKSGVITADVPNSLLQKPYNITAYVCIYEGATFESLYEIVIPVQARKRPGDYTITDTDGEIYSFNALENLLLNTADDLREEHKELNDALTLDYTSLKNTVDNFIAHRYLRTYTNVSQVGCTLTDNTIDDVMKALPTGAELYQSIGATTNTFTSGLPVQSAGVVRFVKIDSGGLRGYVEYTIYGNAVRYVNGYIKGSADETAVFKGWRKNTTNSDIYTDAITNNELTGGNTETDMKAVAEYIDSFLKENQSINTSFKGSANGLWVCGRKVANGRGKYIIGPRTNNDMWLANVFDGTAKIARLSTHSDVNIVRKALCEIGVDGVTEVQASLHMLRLSDKYAIITINYKIISNTCPTDKYGFVSLEKIKSALGLSTLDVDPFSTNVVFKEVHNVNHNTGNVDVTTSYMANTNAGYTGLMFNGTGIGRVHTDNGDYGPWSLNISAYLPGTYGTITINCATIG